MKKTIFSLMVAAMMVAVIGSSPTLAQNSQKGMGKNMPVFADYDLDGNGSITESEFIKARGERIAKRAQEGRQMKNIANALSFQDIDTDGDGTVSHDEFAAHQAEHRAKRSQR